MYLHDSFVPVVFLLALTGIQAETHRHRQRSSRNHEAKRELRESAEHSEEDKSHGSHFSYRDTEEWGNSYSSCSGARQSPIDLNSYEMARLDVPSPLKWQGYRRSPRNMTLSNNGHTVPAGVELHNLDVKLHSDGTVQAAFVELGAFWDSDETPYISGGVLEDDYAFVQLHFHWGPRDDVGSEHTINNRSLPLEMHMVHYKKKYGSVSEALRHEDGLAVVGILFEISNVRSLGLSLMQKYTSSVKIPDTRVEIKPFPLSQFNLDFPDEYVAYMGSLTTPPCSEIVTWILPATPRYLTEEQLDLFRSIELAGGDDHNFRPTKPRNGRMIYYISY